MRKHGRNRRNTGGESSKRKGNETVSVTISIKHALKKYGENVIIPDLSLDIREGEFFTLLGPSGCGKTTLLRMIAGFNSIEGGDFFFSGRRINDLDPARRNIGMVFQNYAIFPHMTVRKNVEFGLKNKKLPAAEIKSKTDEFMKLMQIDQYADRMPERLSGGQQQRVALARALCIEPDVLLFDEPLSNLDAKLRVEMRTVIKNIQHSVNITTVYVTHDQKEAMAVSDRIAVMNAGVIQQVGTPRAIYQRPANLFVSTFIGRSNVMKGHLAVEDGKVWLVTGSGHRAQIETVQEQYKKDQEVVISVRPEEFLPCADTTVDGIPAVVDDCVFLGLNTHYFVHLDSGEEVEIIQESSLDNVIRPGTQIKLQINTEKVNVFSADGSVNLLYGVKSDEAAE